MHDPTVETFKPDAPVFDPLADEREGQETMGTTILAAAYGTGPEDGGVVLAADGRTSTGTYVVNRVANKLTMLTDSIYCCRSGSAADTQNLADMVSQYMRMLEIQLGDKPPVEAAARLFQQLCYYNRFSLSAGIIVAGWDPIVGGACYNIPSGGAKVKVPYALGGSGSTYTYAWADQNWKEGMTMEETREWLRQCVAHAKARDGHSGGNIRTVVLNKDGMQHDMTPDDQVKFTIERAPKFEKLLQQQPPYSSTVKGMYDPKCN